MGMYKQWAEEITTIVESNPAIRNRLRELIKPLAEQDEAYRANEAAGPFDDPCDVLTYRIPGTIITRLDAREEVDLTALPALESEQAERQRQAIMLVGIHDHSGAVKISAGIWPPELLDRVWQRLQSDPPNGPCDTVIKKALAWLRGGFAGEVGGAGQGPATAQGNVTGMPWGEAGARALEIVDRRGFRYESIEKLAKDVGCVPKTLRKAIAKLPELKQALDAAKPQKHPKGVYFSKTHSDHCSSPDVDMATELDARHIVETIPRDEMVRRICGYQRQMWESGHSTNCMTEAELTDQLQSSSDQQVAVVLATVRADADECCADDPKTPGRRPVA